MKIARQHKTQPKRLRLRLMKILLLMKYKSMNYLKKEMKMMMQMKTKKTKSQKETSKTEMTQMTLRMMIALMMNTMILASAVTFHGTGLVVTQQMTQQLTHLLTRMSEDALVERVAPVAVKKVVSALVVVKVVSAPVDVRMVVSAPVDVKVVNAPVVAPLWHKDAHVKIMMVMIDMHMQYILNLFIDEMCVFTKSKN